MNVSPMALVWMHVSCCKYNQWKEWHSKLYDHEAHAKTSEQTNQPLWKSTHWISKTYEWWDIEWKVLL